MQTLSAVDWSLLHKIFNIFDGSLVLGFIFQLYDILNGSLLIFPQCCIFASKNRVSIGSDNGLSPIRRQAIIWSNGGLLSIGSLGANFNSKYKTFDSRKCVWKCRLRNGGHFVHGVVGLIVICSCWGIIHQSSGTTWNGCHSYWMISTP